MKLVVSVDVVSVLFKKIEKEKLFVQKKKMGVI